MFAFYRAIGADNTIAEMTSRSDLCARPKNCVFQDRRCANAATSAHRIRTGKASARINHGVRRDLDRPLSHADITWLPTLLLDDAMDFEVFGAGADIEPLSIIKNHAADFAAFSNPIGQDRNKRNALSWWDPLKNLRVPDRYVSEVVLSRMAVFVFNVHDASVLEGHIRPEPGFSQRQSDIVSLAKMFVDQRLQGEIGQKIAAVNDEWVRLQ